MNIVEITERTPTLIQTLTDLWRGSVKATHLFLSDDEIAQIETYVPHALKNVPILICAEENARPVGFMGIDEQKLEMLFVAADRRNQGIGKTRLAYGIETVKEQNPAAKQFYEHFGFKTDKRTETDEQGNPYPLLYMMRR